MSIENTNLPELVERFGTGGKCRAYLEELRWPEGLTCPALRIGKHLAHIDA